jgi:hypothetical protein
MIKGSINNLAGGNVPLPAALVGEKLMAKIHPAIQG